MTRQQAIKIYLKTQTHAEEIIRRLMGWNPKLSIRENYTNLGVCYETGKYMAQHYKLEFKKIGRGKNYGGLKTNH